MKKADLPADQYVSEYTFIQPNSQCYNVLMNKSVRRLYEQFKPSHYTIELSPNQAAMTFTGRVIIEGQKVGRPSKRLTFHQKGLKITAAKMVRHDKKGEQKMVIDRINHHDSLNEVRLHSAAMTYPGSYVITLDFKGKIQEGMHGIYISKYEIDGKQQTVISTQFESHHAREAFPGIDEPEAKATFKLSLTTQKNDVVLSNMPIADQKPFKFSEVKNLQSKNSNKALTEKVVTDFEVTPRMSTYLLAFVAGDLQHKQTKTRDGVLVRVWSTKAHALDSLDYPLEVIKKGIEFFNDYYGVPYPLAKCDNVAIPDFSSGAMENWGLITYRESVLVTDPKTASQTNLETAALVSLHELSHQWFGNLVTMKWWDDLWLNESFANVMEYVAADALFSDWQVWNTFTCSEGLAAFRRDSIDGVQAVRTNVNHPDEISTLFDPSIVYAKGGRLLNMLMNYLGEKHFKAGLKTYFTKHAYMNTTGDDLWDALGEASDKEVKSFMNPWLTRAGFPVIDVVQNGKDISLSQSHFSLDQSKTDSSRLWPVPTLSDNLELPPILKIQSQTITLSKPDFIRLNNGAVGHYIVNYAEPKHRAALAKLVANKELQEAERLMLLSDSSMLARSGVQSFAATLELLEHYSNEDSEPVWDMISVILADLRRFIDAKPAIEDKIKLRIRQLIAGQYKRLGWEQKTGEPVQDTKLRATIISLGVYAKHTEITAHALKLFNDYQKDTAAIPSELRGIVFGAAIRNQLKGAFDYLIRLEESTNNVNLKQDLLGALALSKAKSDVDVLLSRLKDSKKVRLHDVDHWLVYLMRNRYSQEQAWSWMRNNWQWIEKTFSGDKSYDYFPRYAASALNTRKRLDEYIKFFGLHKSHPVLGRNVTMGIEELNTRIDWLERDAADVQTYLNNDTQ